MPADLDQGRGVCRAPEPAGGTASNGTTATASQFPLASTRATRWRPTTPLMALTPRGPRTERHFTVCVSMIVSRGLGLQPSARRRSGIRSRIMRSNSLNLAQRRNPPWMARQGGMPDGSDRQLPPHPKMRCERLHHGQNWNGILTSWWIILLQPMRHLLHGLSRAYLFQVRRMARPMPLRPHLSHLSTPLGGSRCSPQEKMASHDRGALKQALRGLRVPRRTRRRRIGIHPCRRMRQFHMREPGCEAD